MSTSVYHYEKEISDCVGVRTITHTLKGLTACPADSVCDFDFGSTHKL